MIAFGASDCAIDVAVDRHLKAGVHDTILFTGELFENDLILVVGLKSYNG